MTRSLLERTIDMARAGRTLVTDEPIPTGCRHPDGYMEYLADDGYAYASEPGGEVYLGADSLQFAAFVQQLRLRGRALDLGSGSGLLAARLARSCTHVTALDNSAAAVGASRATLAAECAPDRFEVVHTDLFAYLRETRPVDAVVTNLPFVPVPDGLSYSGYGAGGPTGLSLVERVLTELPAVLSAEAVFCLKVHCAVGPQGPLVAEPIRRFLERTGHAGCLMIDGDVPMAFRAAQSSRNAVPFNPGHDDLLGVFDRHYSHLGEEFVSTIVVTQSASGSLRPGELITVDRRPAPSATAPAGAVPLPLVLRRYGALTAQMPEGYEELGTAAMVDEVAAHAERILELAAAGAGLEQCVREGLPGVAGLDPVAVRGYLVPVDRLRRAAQGEAG
jgi:SAM-dependent methyltransferase